MKKAFIRLFVIAIIGMFVFSSCKKEETKIAPSVPGNEFMTTVKIRLQNQANPNDTIWAVWKDVSQGVNPPDTSLAIINLKRNATYSATVHFYDDTKTPSLDITPEILQRANYHTYWFFKTSGIANHLTINPTDHDTNNPPLFIGLSDTFVTDSTTCSGRLEGVLRHQPNVKNGTYAPGSTDSDVFFTVNILP